MKLIRIALVAGFTLISSCSILPKAEVFDVYRLPSAQSNAAVSHGTPQRWSLRLNKLQASDALNSPNIAVIPQGDLISSYKAQFTRIIRDDSYAGLIEKMKQRNLLVKVFERTAPAVSLSSLHTAPQ